MNKKFFIISGLIIFLLACAAGFFILNKLQKRSERQKLYRQAQNSRAEEIQLTIIEGWSNAQIAELIEKQGITTSKNFLTLLENYQNEKYTGFFPKTAWGSLQGFLYPDTYRIPKPGSYLAKNPEDSVNILIGKMLDNFQLKFTDEMKQKLDQDRENLFNVTILASIIEKETGRTANTPQQKAKLDEERKIVAGIFKNRLAINMPLQSDATVNFATGKNLPQPTAKDLEINSPYNTYKNTGLPPGPICNPSISSILAALTPAQTDYFYFLHRQDTGEAIYSKTFEEHIANKQKYLK